MKIGLFFGSFNPIHIGHVAIAKYFAKQSDLDQIWIVVSPRNPLKTRKILAHENERLAQVRRVIGRSDKIKVSNAEFKLPQPSYTINTLETLKKKFPKYKFVLIMGFDTLKLFHLWKDYKSILKNSELYIYPRKVELNKNDMTRIGKYSNVTFFYAPLFDVSSTFIRKQMKKGKDVRHFLPKH